MFRWHVQLLQHDRKEYTVLKTTFFSSLLEHLYLAMEVHDFKEYANSGLSVLVCT
jgi:hypothetical protein